jgi:hypothetical protein
MSRPSVLLKKSLIFTHRWLGVSLCALFLLWFISGIVVMYSDFPSVSAEDRLERSPSLDGSKIRASPAEAFAILKTQQQPREVRLNTFDGRPVYRFRIGHREQVVYADTGVEQVLVSPEMMRRIAMTWTGQRGNVVKVESLEEVDQWTVQGGIRNVRPVWKYSWPNGEQVYISGVSGEVVQYTTTSSRVWAYLGAIPHWLYFTPLRKHHLEWSQFVIWSSALGTVSVILGIAVGVWMYSPLKCYRFSGAPTSIPYRGQKRWHMILGLIFGLTAGTWVFSGFLSMDPFPTRTDPAGESTVGNGKGGAGDGGNIPDALRGTFQLDSFDAKPPERALAQIGDLNVKEIEFGSFAGQPVYLAALGRAETRIIPVHGEPMTEFDKDRIIEIINHAAGSDQLAELRLMKEYDAYYLDRRHKRPLPVILVRLRDAANTRYYINPKTAGVAGYYNSSRWMARWLYHGLHSLDFPWLYKYRPLWDIIVISLMIGGSALCITSLTLAWRVVRRKATRAVVYEDREGEAIAETPS